MIIMRKTLTIFRESSKRIYIIESIKPMPAVSSARQTPTTNTRGIVHAIDCPEIRQTIVKGIMPMKKLTRPAKAVEIGNTCGGT